MKFHSYFILLLCFFSPSIFAADKLTYLGANEYSMDKTAALKIAGSAGFDFEYFNLDAITNLEQEVSRGLPQDRVKAEAIANERLSNLDEKEIVNYIKGPALLLRWDIKKIPALVFGDGEYVIYGVTNLAVALQQFSNSRKR